MDICLCTYGMCMILEIFRPSLKCHIRALVALSPEYPQRLFAEHIQTCYIVYEHIFLSAGSQIDAIVNQLITENFLPTVEICKSYIFSLLCCIPPCVFSFLLLNLILAE